MKAAGARPNARVAGQPELEFRSMPVLITGAVLSTVLVVASLFGWMMLGSEIRGQFTIPQILTLLGFIALMIGMMLAIGLSSVSTDEQGVRIRNGLRTTRYRWDEVRDVQFGQGDPWAYLVTGPEADEDEQATHMVLAIQRSEGPAAEDHVAQLRAAIARHRA